MKQLANELEVFNLAMAFRREYVKYDPRIFTAKSVKNSKWWVFFERTIDKFASRPEWNADIFVKCQFEREGKILPFKLANEEAWKTFIDYKFRFEEQEDDEVKTIKNVLAGYALVRDYCKGKDIPFSVQSFLESDYHKRMLINGAYPVHFFSFSKSCSELGLKNKRMIVCRYKKLLLKIKEILGDDYVY